MIPICLSAASCSVVGKIVLWFDESFFGGDAIMLLDLLLPLYRMPGACLRSVASVYCPAYLLAHIFSRVSIAHLTLLNLELLSASLLF